MVFFVLRKLILQTHMSSHPVGLDVWFLVWPFVYFHTVCVRIVKALARLLGCAGSPEPSLVEAEFGFLRSCRAKFFRKKKWKVRARCPSIFSSIAIELNVPRDDLFDRYRTNFYHLWSRFKKCRFSPLFRGARWLSGRVSDSGARGRGFETYRRRVVSLSKTLYSPKVLVNYPGSGGSVPTWLTNCCLGR